MRIRKSMWRLPVIAALALSLLLLAARAEPGNKPVKAVAVLLGDLGNPFFSTVARAAEEEAQRIFGSGIRISIASSGYDVGRQVKQINDYVREGYGLLILNAADTDLIANTVRNATANGTVVVAVDVKASGAQATVMSDNVEAGMLACNFMAMKLQHRGNVVILNGPPVSAVIDRVAGCRQALAQYPDLTVLSDGQNAGASFAGGLASMSSLMADYEKIDAVFAINDPSALGAEFAARQAGRKDFFITSVDASPEALEVMRSPNSLMVASVAQDPRAMAALAVQAGYTLISGKALARNLLLTPVTLVTKDNIDAFDGWDRAMLGAGMP